MRSIIRVSVLLSVAITSSFLPAQETQRKPRREITFAEVLRREDANKDGKVTREEFQASEKLFKRLDHDGDNVLTKVDFAHVAPQRNRTGAGLKIPGNVRVIRNVVFGTGGGRELTMHIVQPVKKSDKPLPVYVWIHGGGWMGGNKEGGVRQVMPMVQNGFVGATIEYRLTGEAPFPAQIEDCKCAIRYLRAHAEKYNINSDKIAVGGSSAGGHLVALLGTSGGVKELEGSGGWPEESSSVQAVVDLYGPTDFSIFVTTKGYENHNLDGSPESRLLGGGEVITNLEGIKRVNPITYVDKKDPPFLIIHGGNDRTVPSNQSTAMHKALSSAGIESTLHIIDGAGHGGPEFSKPEIKEMKKSFLIKVFAE